MSLRLSRLRRWLPLLFLPDAISSGHQSRVAILGKKNMECDSIFFLFFTYIRIMIPRVASAKLKQLAMLFKAVAVIGPRQSGKTTLVRSLFTDKPYVSLEDPDTRQYALEDPRGFLANYPNGAILDEAQRTPNLFSYLQGILDERNRMGEFIITGSNNFLLQQNITQSLAGRVAYLQLLPFALQELYRQDSPELAHQDTLLLTGGYPPIHDYRIPPPGLATELPSHLHRARCTTNKECNRFNCIRTICPIACRTVRTGAEHHSASC